MPKEIKTTKKSTTKKPAPALKKTVKKPVSKSEKTNKVVAQKKTASKKLLDLDKQKTAALIKKIKLAEKAENTEFLFKKTANQQKKSKKIISNEDEIVILPNKVNLRLLERVKQYQEKFYKKSEEVVIRVAIIGGYIFIFSGLLFSLLTIKSINNQALKANIITTLCEKEKDCFNNSGTTSNVIADKNNSENQVKNSELFLTSATENQEPTLAFLNQPDLSTTEDFHLQASLKFVENPLLILTSETTGEVISIENTKTEADIYTFILPISVLVGDNFNVTVEATAIATKNKILFQGRPLLFKTAKDTPNKKIGETAEEGNQELIEVEEVEVLDDSEAFDKEDEKTDSVGGEEKSTENNDEINNEISEGDLTENSLRATFVPETKALKLSLISETAKKVEIYAQNKLSHTPIFLGLATKINTNWTYFIKENSLPAGNYIFFAKTENNTEINRSDFISVTINHENLSTEQNSLTENNTDIVILNEKVKKAFAVDGDESVLIVRQNYFSNFAESLKEIGENKTNQILNTEVNNFLAEKAIKLNGEFSRFGSIFLVQNPSLLSLAQNQLQEVGKDLTQSFLENTNYSSLEKEEVTFLIQEKLAFLQDKVKDYEVNLKNRSDLIKKDSDSDGVSDFDEVNIYNTNPFHPDSDGDRFLDGVEIARNFNPLNPNSENYFTPETPERIKAQSTFNLKINQISPLVKINNEIGLAQVFLKIEGEGIPNSFVTLITKNDFKTITNFAKTNKDGKFSFVLEKELTNGEYSAYLLYSANSGKIIDRSEAFVFTKTGDLIKNNNVNNTTLTSSENHYLVAQELSYSSSTASMGVVSLGIILLSMGKILLREKREEEIEEVSLQKNLKGRK